MQQCLLTMILTLIIMLAMIMMMIMMMTMTAVIIVIFCDCSSQQGSDLRRLSTPDQTAPVAWWRPQVWAGFPAQCKAAGWQVLVSLVEKLADDSRATSPFMYCKQGDSCPSSSRIDKVSYCLQQLDSQGCPAGKCAASFAMMLEH